MKSPLETKRIFADLACAKCEGVGMYPHPESGAMTHCDCHFQEKKRILMRRAGFPKKHIGSTVAAYSPNNEAERLVKRVVTAWVKNFKAGCPGLYLYGAAGTGKTHLLVAIGKALVDHYGTEVLYASTAELVARAKAQFSKNADTDILNPFDEASEAQVLLLDDIGTEKPSEWLLEQMYRLFNTRYNDGLTTLLTSNVSLESFEATYDARIADRIHEMTTPLHCDGESRRRQNKGVVA